MLNFRLLWKVQCTKGQAQNREILLKEIIKKTQINNKKPLPYNFPKL